MHYMAWDKIGALEAIEATDAALSGPAIGLNKQED
jgi:hypothetical protein